MLLFAILQVLVWRFKWLQRRGALVATFRLAEGQGAAPAADASVPVSGARALARRVVAVGCLAAAAAATKKAAPKHRQARVPKERQLAVVASAATRPKKN